LFRQIGRGERRRQGKKKKGEEEFSILMFSTHEYILLFTHSPQPSILSFALRFCQDLSFIPLPLFLFKAFHGRMLLKTSSCLDKYTERNFFYNSLTSGKKLFSTFTEKVRIP